MKKLITLCLIMVLFCSGSNLSMKEYHQRRVVQFQRKVVEYQKKVNYHQQKIYYYESKEK